MVTEGFALEPPNSWRPDRLTQLGWFSAGMANVRAHAVRTSHTALGWHATVLYLSCTFRDESRPAYQQQRPEQNV